MDGDKNLTESLLKKNLKVSEENNKLLKKIYRMMRWTRILSVLYWAIVLGAAVGLYYFIQPFVEPILDAFGSIREGIGGIRDSLPNTGFFEKQETIE